MRILPFFGHATIVKSLRMLIIPFVILFAMSALGAAASFGLGRALEFVYTGQLDAERAFQWGMLNHLVPSEKLEETTRALCARMMEIPPLVQWVSKRIMRTAVDTTLENTMVLTSNASPILQHSEDAKEARRAFVEKRKPNYTGR